MVTNGSPRDGNSILDWASKRCGIGAILAFFSTRVLRGGPKILLYLATFLVLLLVVTRVLPEHLTGTPFGSKNQHFWNWADGMNDGAAQKVPGGKANSGGAADGGAGPGSLRVVVFGENDIATPARMQGLADKKHRGWTEVLCEELGCSSYLSFVPTFDGPSRSMTSNNLYAASLDESLNLTAPSTSPALDYSFLPRQYPVPWELPDLSDQVSAFLSMEKPEVAPAETLWVFSFGTWDVWSLAAMPHKISSHIVDVLVDHIFTEVERLYHSSLDPNSVAWSNSSAPVAPGVAGSDGTRDSTLPSGFNVASVSDGLATAGAQDAKKNGGSDRMKHFRIIIPKLFDPSLTPGWRSARPKAPAVHSAAEQLRHAVTLTKLWNDHTHKLMSDWVKTPHPKRSVRNPETKEPQQYPQRDVIAYDMPDYLMDMIVEGQLRSAGVTDSIGTGTRPTNQTFREVRAPCVKQATVLHQEEHDAERNTAAKAPATAAKPTTTVMKPAAAITAKSKAQATQPSVRRRAGTTPRASSSGGSGNTVREPSAPLQVCDTPHEHLFFTPFALSPRAIADIASQVADMVQHNETVRARWAAAAELAGSS